MLLVFFVEALDASCPFHVLILSSITSTGGLPWQSPYTVFEHISIYKHSCTGRLQLAQVLCLHACECECVRLHMFKCVCICACGMLIKPMVGCFSLGWVKEFFFMSFIHWAWSRPSHWIGCENTSLSNHIS